MRGQLMLTPLFQKELFKLRSREISGERGISKVLTRSSKNLTSNGCWEWNSSLTFLFNFEQINYTYNTLPIKLIFLTWTVKKATLSNKFNVSAAK